jgi:hypothetical protein
VRSSSGVAGQADRALLGALAALAAALRDIPAPSMVIGGIGVIARGVPRQTIDVDATVWAEAIDAESLLAGLARHGLVPRIEGALEFARQHQILQLRHEPSGTPVDLSLAWLPFEREALARSSLVDFGGVSIPVATPEDLIIYKAVAWRDRDRSDIERLLVRHGRAVNLDRIRALVSDFALALDEPERVEQFEALVARALGSAGLA